MISVEDAKIAFKQYISNYDINNDKINLKVIHMYHVADNAKKIAKSLKLSEEEQKIAEIIGLLHDIGRFEQIRLYNTFSDKLSIDHGQKSVELLFGDKLIRNFIEDDSYDSIIYKAINNHNKLEIGRGLSEKELLHSKIIRDADNIDVYRGLLEQKMEDFVFKGSKDISNEILTESYFEDFKKEKLLEYNKCETDMDVILAILAHIFAINFIDSLKIIRENNYIEKIVERLNCKDIKTKNMMNEVVEITNNYINKRIKEGK